MTNLEQNLPDIKVIGIKIINRTEFMFASDICGNKPEKGLYGQITVKLVTDTEKFFNGHHTVENEHTIVLWTDQLEAYVYFNQFGVEMMCRKGFD